MSRSKSAGKFHISASDPSPVWFAIDTSLPNGDVVQLYGLQLEDLHDLRYLIDRMIAQGVGK